MRLRMVEGSTRRKMGLRWLHAREVRLWVLRRQAIRRKSALVGMSKAWRWLRHVLLVLMGHPWGRKRELRWRLLMTDGYLSWMVWMRRLWLCRHESVDLLQRCLWWRATLLVGCATLEHCEKMICLRHLRLLLGG